MSMRYLLFPGRHLANTRFQHQYLFQVLRRPARRLDYLDGPPQADGELTEVVFAVTSANRENSRYNCVPFHVRAVGVDRFARDLAESLGVRHRILGIPHFPPTPQFAHHVLREIAEQTEHSLVLRPENTVVLCSTPAVIGQFQELGFAILPAELGETGEELPALPIDLVRAVAEQGSEWSHDAMLRRELAPATFSLWCDFPEVPLRIQRLFHDPLLTEQGDLTDTRDYSTYGTGMSGPALLEVKYRDVQEAIVEGRIVDEGCADGALLALIARDFPDSDLIGIEITGEFLAQCHERQRRGEYRGTFIHFHQRNLMEEIFEPGSIDTTLCNSTTHEIWSYGSQEPGLRAYLKRKFEQTRPGGRLIIRDVVGPENPDQEVWLWCNPDDGRNAAIHDAIADRGALARHLQGLSTAARFQRFAADFLADDRAAGHRGPETQVVYREETHGGRTYFVVRLKDAAEFLSRKDYVDNWKSELHEEFAFWSPSVWKQALRELGFVLIETPDQEHSPTRAYCNPWIVENRYEGKVALYRPPADGGAEPERVPYPPTNILLVAERPAGLGRRPG